MRDHAKASVHCVFACMCVTGVIRNRREGEIKGTLYSGFQHSFVCVRVCVSASVCVCDDLFQALML